MPKLLLTIGRESGLSIKRKLEAGAQQQDMNQEQLFFSILRSVLWGTEAKVPTDTDWQGVLNLAARQKCLHALSVWLKAHRISTPFDKQLRPTMFIMLQRQARLNQLAISMIDLLMQHNIPATLIKGYSLSALYPDPDTRDFGDVDIYVGEEHYERATEIAKAAYPHAHWYSETHGGIHFILVIDENLDRVVELHRVTMEFHDKRADALYQAFTHKHLDGSTTLDIYGHAVPVPSAAYNALYVFMHAWHHFESTGVGFRPLADWALCLHQAHEQLSAEEWSQLCQEIDGILTALRMKTAWQTFGHVLVEQLQLPAACFPLYTTHYQRRAARLLRQLVRDGHGGRPTKVSIQEIALMRRFPCARPTKHRVMQVAYTACRLIFDAWQMGKLFPDLAWHELVHSVRMAFAKKH